MIRLRDLSDLIVAQKVLASTFLHSLSHMQKWSRPIQSLILLVLLSPLVPRNLDRQEPAVLAQLQSRMKCRFVGVDAGNCVIVVIVVLLQIDVETIEGA